MCCAGCAAQSSYYGLGAARSGRALVLRQTSIIEFKTVIAFIERGC